MKKFCVVCILTLALLIPMTSTASAQTSSDEAAAGVASTLYSLTTTTGPLLTTGGVILTIVMVTSDDSAELEQYMRDNAVALQHDLHLGGGDSAEDLAMFFGVEDDQRQAFSELLHENRSQLAPLAEPGAVDRAKAVQFAQIIVEEMSRHEELATSVRPAA